MLVATLHGCGKKEEAAPAATRRRPRRPPPRAVPATDEEKVVNVYNWSDYIDPTMLEKFTAETGIKVNYDVFDSNEVLETKLLAGNTGYDVVVPSASFLERQIKAGVFRKLDRSKLTNWGNLDTEVLQRVALHDPGNEHSVDHMWGTDGIGYNEGKIKKIDAERAGRQLEHRVRAQGGPRNSRTAVFRCSTRRARIVGAMLAYIGKDPNSQSEADLKARRRQADGDSSLHPHDPQLEVHRRARERRDLPRASAGAATSCRHATAPTEAGQGNVIKYSVPKEGTIIWFDMYAIPADAPHPDNAHAFINFMMQPDVAAANSNFVNYATGNAASVPLVNEDVRNDPGVYPPPEVKAKLFPDLSETDEFTRLLNRTWTRFTTGK